MIGASKVSVQDDLVQTRVEATVPTQELDVVKNSSVVLGCQQGSSSLVQLFWLSGVMCHSFSGYSV